MLCALPAAAALGAQSSFPSGVRRGHILAYDSARSDLLVFGGLQPPEPSGFEPLWSCRGERWRQVGACGPRARSLVAAAFDAARNMLVVYGGAGLGYNTRYGDLWEWNGARWSEILPSGDWPGPRDHHVMVYDAGRGKVVLYGGSVSLTQTTGLWYTDTWEWDGRTWKRFDIPGPGPRVHHAMAYDPIRRQTILCGGFGQESPYSGETWAWDGTAWKKLSEEGLPSRARHRMAFHQPTGEIILFGGDRVHDGPGIQALSDTRVWDGQRWTERKPKNSPGPRFVHAMTYDPKRKLVMLYGGQPEEHRADDLWAWDGIDWQQIGG